MKRIFLVIYLFILVTSALSAELYINEVLASNNAVNANSFGDYGDWVELYNSGTDPIDLSGYYLSDSVDDLQKWVFPTFIIPASTYLLIWATDRDIITAGNEIHTNFKISSGETISLSAPDLQLVDQVVLPILQANISYGRQNDAPNAWVYYISPTPGLSNSGSTGYLGFLAAANPSHSSGFYADPIALGFENIPAGAQLIYTLDGSVPSLGNPATQIYEPASTMYLQDKSSEPNSHSGIRTTALNSTAWQDTWYPPAGVVAKANIIRARLIQPGYMDGALMNLTYFIGTDLINRYSDMPVISLMSDPAGLFDDYTGIYVAGLDSQGMPNTTTTANYQQDWEREAAFQLWEVNRNDGFSAGAAMKIHGSASARLNRKALRLNFKGSLGFQELSYPLLNPEITESFDAFLIRASGQDAHHLQFRDAIGQVFFKNQDVGSTDFRPIVLFMNGEYWGIHNLRERSDENFIARYYEADVDEMDCLENRGVANPEERVGTRTRYMEMLSYAKNNDLDVETNYQTLSTMMDMDNYINYYIAQVFVANSDWPSYNVRMWRHKTEVDNPGVFYQENLNNRYLDGRYRWILFDLDQSLGRFHNANTNTLQAASAVGTWNDNFFVLFRKLLGPPPLRERLQQIPMGSIPMAAAFSGVNL